MCWIEWRNPFGHTASRCEDMAANVSDFRYAGCLLICLRSDKPRCSKPHPIFSCSHTLFHTEPQSLCQSTVWARVTGHAIVLWREWSERRSHKVLSDIAGFAIYSASTCWRQGRYFGKIGHTWELRQITSLSENLRQHVDPNLPYFGEIL